MSVNFSKKNHLRVLLRAPCLVIHIIRDEYHESVSLFAFGIRKIFLPTSSRKSRWQNTGFVWHSNDAKGKVVSFIKKTYNNMPFLILLFKSKNEVSRLSEFFY